MLSSADVARRLMLIAKWSKWQFVVKTFHKVSSVAIVPSLCWLASYLKSLVFFWTRRDSGKCDKRTVCHHRKCVPGSIPTMEETL